MVPHTNMILEDHRDRDRQKHDKDWEKLRLQEHQTHLGGQKGLRHLPVVQVVLEVAVSNPKLQILHKLHIHRRKQTKKVSRPLRKGRTTAPPQHFHSPVRFP